jgi:hypothetical protein
MHAKVMPKTNISKRQYDHIVDEIEHDPLIKRTTLAVACMVAASCVLTGLLIWFARANPGNLIQTTGTVTGISSGLTDSYGTDTTFVTFEFKTREGDQKSVRASTSDGLKYSEGQDIRIGYHPRNPNFARNFRDNRPPQVALYLWTVPFLLMIWLIFTALFRHHARQVEIWNAAEAADSDD